MLNFLDKNWQDSSKPILSHKTFCREIYERRENFKEKVLNLGKISCEAFPLSKIFEKSQKMILSKTDF